MSKTVKIESLNDLDVLSNVTRNMFEKSGSLQATIKKLDESLSDRQRGLYWRWLTIFAAKNGDTKTDFHNQYKENVFFPIFLADEDNHHSLRDAVSTMRQIRNEISDARYATLRKYIIDSVSHLDATVANMGDILRQLQSDAADMGVALPQPPGNELNYGK